MVSICWFFFFFFFAFLVSLFLFFFPLKISKNLNFRFYILFTTSPHPHPWTWMASMDASDAPALKLKCYFTSTETVGLLGTGAQDGHLDSHTAPELWDTTVQCCFTSTETIRLIRDGSPGRPRRLSHSSWALMHRCPRLFHGGRRPVTER